MDEFFVAAYDGGGTNLRVAVARSDGSIVSRVEKNIERVYGRDTPQEIGNWIDDAIQKADIGDAKIVAIGGSQAGTIDREHGVVIFSPNIEKGYTIGVGPYLTHRFNVPSFIENDGDAAAYGVLRKDPQAKGMKDIIYLIMGTGIGGGIIHNGEIYSGPISAAEVGHMVIVPDGRECGCRKRGCWEAYCSGSGIAGWVNENELLAEVIRSVSHAEGELKAEHVFKVAENVSLPPVVEFINKVGDYNAIAVSNLVNVLGPEAVFIGEAVARNNPIILDMLEEKVPQHLMPGIKRPKFFLTELDNPGLYGAAYIAIERYQQMQKPV